MFDNYYYDDYYDGDYDDDPEYMLHEREDKISEIVDEWEKNTMLLAEDKWLDGKELFQCELILKHKFNNEIVVFGNETSDKTHTNINYMSHNKISDNYLWNNDYCFKEGIDTAKTITETVIGQFYNIKELDIDKYLNAQIKQLVLKNQPELIQIETTKQSPISVHQLETTRQLETAQKTGYVQGVCESVLAFNNDENRKIMTEATMNFLSKKLLSEMNVTKDMAQKFANPETYKALEKCVFTPKQEQKLEQTQSQGRGM